MAALLLTACRAPLPDDATPSRAPTVTLTPRIGVNLATRVAPTAVIIQTTPTPLPTPTVTPTATPILYQIAAGDTLLAIAIARQTTVSQILELNPGTRPEALQIGATLILPPPATPIAQTALATVTPMELTVTAVTLYRTPLNGLWILGELRNDGDLPVENVRVEINLLDAAGRPAATTTAWALPAVVPPGATAPFGVLLPQAPADIAAPAAAVIGGQTVADLGSRYLNLASEATMITIDGGRLQLEGWVENVGEATAVQIVLVAAFYDAQGRVTGYQVHYFDETLPPDGRLPFNLTAAPPGGQTVDFRLAVQAIILRSEE